MTYTIKKSWIILLLCFSFNKAFAGFIDKYSFNFGTSLATQFWHYKLTPVEFEKTYKMGLLVNARAEKQLNEKFSVFSEIGYISKGFKNLHELRFGDGTSGDVYNKNVNLHDIAFKLNSKFAFKKSKPTPYAFLGVVADYTFQYNDIYIHEKASGKYFNMFKYQLDQNSKLNAGISIGFGYQFKKGIYIELECNPNLTYSFNDPSLSIKDNCFNLKAGFVIGEE